MLRMLRSLSLGVLVLAGGCGNYNPPTSRADLAQPLGDGGLQDLGASGDLAGPQPDMTVTIPVPAGCNTATIVTGTQAYATLTNTNGQRCFGAGCHNGAQRPVFTSQTTFMNAVINQSSTTGVAYITPNNPDKSYLLYKLRGLQTLIRNGAGQQMPKGGTPLTDAQFCMMYDWVLHGAPRN